MSGTVTFILGLSGSGKSHLMARLLVDRAFEENFATDEKFHEELVSRLKKGQRCAVSELAYLDKDNRDKYVTKLRADAGADVHINWLCFENNISAANANCPDRSDKPRDKDDSDHRDINFSATGQYEYPEGATILKIHQRIVPG